MRLPFGWLQDFVKIDVAPEEACEYLIMLGFSDARVLPKEWECLDNFVAGRATAVEPNPRDSKLKIAHVNVGYANLISVCGAPNVKAGEVYPVAMPGARLGSGRYVETAEIAGVESQCILCSGWEAWIDDSKEELLTLDREISPGTKLIEALRLDEPVIEMEVTPNRGDCLGLIGVARELAAVFGKTLIIPEPALSETGRRIEDLVSVEIMDVEACPRYGAIGLENVIVRGAPAETRARLRLAGVRPINNVVDAANIVLFETGHPLHAFDLDRIAGRAIVVRRARQGERISAIDGRKYELDAGDLVIADSDKPVALAGIIGAENSEVTPSTTRVLIEGACFKHTFIWRTSKRLNIESEAAYRFARGVDVGAVLYVLARTASLIQADTKCSVSAGMIDVYPEPQPPKRVFVNPKRLNALLGTAIPEQEILDYLERLGFLVSPGKDLEVVVPTRRNDVEREADIAEEIARLYGYDRIDLSTNHTCSSYGTYTQDAEVVKRVRTILTGMGLNEAVTDATIGPDKIERLRLRSQQLIEIRNPVGIQNSILRPSLLPGLLETLTENERRGADEIAFFELGPVYRREGSEYEESRRLSLGLSGVRQARAWYAQPRDFDFYDLKGILESLAESLRVDLAFDKGSHELLHAGRRASVSLMDDDAHTEIGYLGEIAPEMVEALGSRRRLYVAEIDLEGIIELASEDRKYHGLQRYPAVKRDIAVVVPKNLLESEVRNAILAEGGPLVESLQVFDVYEGDRIPAGTKSLAYAIVFRSPDGTLTEQDVDERQKRIELVLERDFGGKIRTKE